MAIIFSPAAVHPSFFWISLRLLTSVAKIPADEAGFCGFDRLQLVNNNDAKNLESLHEPPYLYFRLRCGSPSKDESSSIKASG
jgi:hypothetical protein